MKPFYGVYLYHDTARTLCISTHEEEHKSALETHCRKLYDQLRAMGAHGEIRVIRHSRENFGFHENQVAFVILDWYEFDYVETK